MITDPEFSQLLVGMNEEYASFELFCGLALQGELDRYRAEKPLPSDLHLHTQMSYNPENWSPERVVAEAWLKRVPVVGTVDFDGFGSMDRAWAAGCMLGQRVVASFETRVFLPEFADIEINSPGEPGVAYIEIIGTVPGKDFERALHPFTAIAHLRNMLVLDNLLGYLGLPGLVDYLNVRAMASGMPTERHIVGATIKAVDEHFGLQNVRKIADFWSAKLGGKPVSDGGVNPDDIRKLIKVGGQAYEPFDPKMFASMDGVRALAEAAGGIPAYCVLNGRSQFEENSIEMIRRCRKLGVQALNFIAWRMSTDSAGLRWADDVLDLAHREYWLSVAGAEMNSPGQKPFGAIGFTNYPELLSLGAQALYGHTVLQRAFDHSAGWMSKMYSGKPNFDWFQSIGDNFNPLTDTPEELRQSGAVTDYLNRDRV